MKNKKAILILILAAIVVALAAMFKESIPKAVSYISCILGFVFASVAVCMEKKNSP